MNVLSQPSAPPSVDSDSQSLHILDQGHVFIEKKKLDQMMEQAEQEKRKKDEKKV